MNTIESNVAMAGFKPQIAGHGYIGATPFVNYSINTADGSSVSGADSYEAETAAENALHARKMAVMPTTKAKQYELKRHIGALSYIDKKYGMFQKNANFIGSVKNAADGTSSNASGASSSSSSSSSDTASGSNTGTSSSNSSAAPAKKKSGIGNFFSSLVADLNGPSTPASTTTPAGTVATPSGTSTTVTVPAAKTILGMPSTTFYVVLAVVAAIVIFIIYRANSK